VYFDGHFPGAPVVAGVVQIKWALELGERYVGTRGRCVGMEGLKFQQVMVPGLAVTLTLRWAATEGKLHFAFAAGGARFGSGRLVLVSEP
jgi:3-hydroxymyristoyl/3-hydroxydecanoyl-(acyl carrier protein) dehydratase